MKKIRVFLLRMIAIWIGICIVFSIPHGLRFIDDLMNSVSFLEERKLQEQTPEGYNFYYDQLTEQEQMAYRAILYGVSHSQDEFYIGNDYTPEILKRIMYAFTYDYPEYFWCLQYQTKIYSDQAYYLVFEKDANREQEAAELKEQADKVVQKISEKKGKYKQIKAIYDYIIDHTEYMENSQYDQDIRSVLLYQKSVCSGYAKTFQYLCKRLGIACTTVNGYSIEQGSTKIPHSWNLLCLKDQYYWVDVTWGDSRDTTQKAYVNYRYFMTADDPFLNSHKIDEYMDDQTRENSLFTYPECQDETRSYYYKKGCYFQSYNKKKISQYLSSRLKKNLHARIELQFAGKKAYQKAYRDLIQNRNIEDIYKNYIPYNTNVSYEYAYDEDSYLLFFFIP